MEEGILQCWAHGLITLLAAFLNSLSTCPRGPSTDFFSESCLMLAHFFFLYLSLSYSFAFSCLSFHCTTSNNSVALGCLGSVCARLYSFFFFNFFILFFFYQPSRRYNASSISFRKTLLFRNKKFFY